MINLQRMKDDKTVGRYVKRSFLPSIIEELETSLAHENSYRFAIMNTPYCLTIERVLTFENNIKYILVKAKIEEFAKLTTSYVWGISSFSLASNVIQLF